MKNINRDKYFRSASFPLVTFLYTKNQQVVGITPTGEGSKKEFSFLKTDYLEELVDLYKFGDRDSTGLLVSVHLYEQARRELLDRLNN